MADTLLKRLLAIMGLGGWLLIRPVDDLTVRAEPVAAQAAFRQAPGKRPFKFHDTGSTVTTVMADASPALPVGKVTWLTQNLAIDVEIAADDASRRYGLMNRAELAENRGMLFVYPHEKVLGVWMKNTLIPLDVVFLTAEGYVTAIEQNLQPCPPQHCQVFDSQVPAQYMLEMKAGFVAQHHIKIGQKVRMELHAVTAR